MTLVKNGKADYSRWATAMEFSCRGGRWGSTLNTRRQVEIYSQGAEYGLLDGKLLRRNMGVREILAKPILIGFLLKAGQGVG